MLCCLCYPQHKQLTKDKIMDLSSPELRFFMSGNIGSKRTHVFAYVCVCNNYTDHTAVCTSGQYLLEGLMSTYTQCNKTQPAFVEQNKPITCDEM